MAWQTTQLTSAGLAAVASHGFSGAACGAALAGQHLRVGGSAFSAASCFGQLGARPRTQGAALNLMLWKGASLTAADASHGIILQVTS